MTATLASALVAAQKDMPAVEDNARANYGTYVTLDHLIAKTRPVLNKHGLAIVQFPVVTELGAPALRTILIHGESGEQISADAPLYLDGKQHMQALGGAITYARRYGWGAALGISTDSDDDGQAVSAKVENPAPAAAEQKNPGAASAPTESAQPEPQPVIRNPSGERRSDAQANKLRAQLRTLVAANAMTEPAFLKAAHNLDVSAASVPECLDRVTKAQASNLIDRLTKLEESVKAQAAA